MPTTAKSTFTQDSEGRWVILKDPDAVLEYTIDWSKWLRDIDNDTIVSHEVVLGDTPSITVNSSTNTDTAVRVVLSGGTAGTLEPFTVRITTASFPERIEDRTAYVQIEER